MNSLMVHRLAHHLSDLLTDVFLEIVFLDIDGLMKVN